MHWNTWIREVHRWLSIAFTMTVIANLVAMAIGKPPPWVVYSPLPLLFVLMFTGLYMFALPYAAKRRTPLMPRRAMISIGGRPTIDEEST